MSTLSQLHRISHQVAVSLLLLLLCACSFYEYTPADDADLPTSSTTQVAKYINLSIVVSSGNEGSTRATTRDNEPKGGEDGDGRETGLDRENFVKGITLMLYEAKKMEGENEISVDINTVRDNDRIIFTQYYSVDLLKQREPGQEKKGEAIYQTGEQPLAGTAIKTDKQYRVIVVANQDLTTRYPVGTPVKTIRDHIINTIYDGNGIGINAKNFVMSLETDCIFDFSTATTERSDDQITYNFDNIRIERLAARVDFWMNNAEYKNGNEYKTPGYEYSVNGSSDKFVLTAVMPFNLYIYNDANDNPGEYLFKRSNDGGSINYLSSNYLSSENNTGFVIDPKTSKKTGKPEENYYNNPLDYLVQLQTGDPKVPTFADIEDVKEYYLTTKALHENVDQKATFTGDNSKDNFILCYPKENTLMLASPLYYYATGVVIEGDYYKSGQEQPTHYVYYGYLRHQGEGYDKETYYSIRPAEDLSKTETGNNNVHMNFGVVRNNIYRISIDGITEKTEDKDDKPQITLRIVVKNWDVFTHKEITM